MLPSQPPSPPLQTPKCLEVPLDGQTSGETQHRLGRGKGRAGAIKREEEKPGEEKEFLSIHCVPQPSSKGMTKVLMSLSLN